MIAMYGQRTIFLAAALALGGCGDPATLSHGPANDLSASAGDLGGPDMASVCGACVAPTTACDPKTRKCVECVADGDCPNQFVCAKQKCVPGCSKAHAECGDGGSCDLDGGVCHGCLADRDCKDQGAPLCDLASGRCGACTTQNDRCPAGQYCGQQGNTLRCLPGCRGDRECQGADGGTLSAACCAHQCVDTAVAATNCGACGVDCKGGTCCAGACADTQGDVQNCGGCHKVCSTQNQVPTCTAGVCGSAGCTMGFADCNNNQADGCETSTSGDPKNCGACGKACSVPNAQSLCVAGTCVIGSCKMDFRDCNNMLADGCEVNSQTDPLNCGACGANCAKLPNAAASCAMGACAIGMCNQGFGNCNKMDIDGCESPLDADPANCGGCGKVCPAPPGVAAVCMNSMCSLGGCRPGFLDCNNNMGDGCEAQIAVDANNCGMCGNACPALPNASSGCVGGACAIGVCNQGYADCDLKGANGCEVNTASDAANCGACGKACANGTLCVNGMCGCQPSGQRAAFNSMLGTDTVSCWHSSPCATDQQSWSGAGLNFSAYGQSFTCGGGPATCIAHVGIGTYQGSPTVCQGRWDVYCDNVMVGTINTLGTTCTGSSMGNNCNVSFPPRVCTSVKLVAAQDGDNTAGCCNSAQPDSMLTAISAW